MKIISLLLKQRKKLAFNLIKFGLLLKNDNVFVYGPSQHYIDVIGYIATKETHDGETYYTEDESDEFDED